MDVQQLKIRLQKMTEEYWALIHPEIRHDTLSSRQSLRREILELQREIGLLEGREVAMPWEWPAPHSFRQDHYPIVLTNTWNTFLLYYSRVPFVEREQTTMPSTDNHWRNAVALVSFQKCAAVKFGTPNDEVLEGHPLYGSGIDVLGAYTVKNSRWLEELRTINRVHSQYNPTYWDKLQHYLLFFKEKTFECVAGDVLAEQHDSSFADVIAIATDRLHIPPRRG